MRHLHVILLVAALTAQAMAVDPEIEVNKIFAPTGDRSDAFGRGIAINSTTLLIGATDTNGHTGSVHVFDRGSFTPIGEWTADDGGPEHEFGGAIALSGSIAVIGASEAINGNGVPGGAAYVFDTQTGLQRRKLVPENGDGQDRFGYSVDVEGTTVVVGAWGDTELGDWHGAAYVFDALTGEQTLKLLPGDGAPFDSFGYAVATNGTTAIVGSPFNVNADGGSGAVYCFDIGTGEQIDKIYPGDSAPGDLFGCSLAVLGAKLLVGAYLDDDNGEDSGSVYVYDLADGRQLMKLDAGDGQSDDHFGRSVAISGTLAAVGAPDNDTSMPRTGAVYLFDLISGDQIRRFLASDRQQQDLLGSAVGIDGDLTIAGATNADGIHSGTGAAYVFDTSPVCPGDANGDCFVDSDDLISLIIDWGTDGSMNDADVDGSGIVDVDDLLVVLLAWGPC